MFAIAQTVFSGLYLPGHRVKFECNNTTAYATVEATQTESEEGREFAESDQVQESVYVPRIQEKVLEFLLSMCELILHDVDCTTPVNMVPQPEPPSLLLQSIAARGEQPLLSAIAAEAAYRAPALISFDLLAELMQARVDALKDHVFELRQDPRYFTEAVGVVDSHDGSRKIFGLKAKGCTGIWETVASPCMKVVHFNELLASLRMTTSLNEHYSAQLVRTCPDGWPEDYQVALLQLSTSISDASRLILTNLKQSLYWSPSLRHIWEKISILDALQEDTSLKAKKDLRKSDPLVSLLCELTWKYVDWATGLHLILEDIDHLRAISPERNVRITPLVSDLLADLGVIEEINRQLRQHHRNLYFPWCERGRYGRNHVAREQTSKFKSEMIKIRKIAFLKPEKVVFGETYAPKNPSFHYPAEKRRTAERVSQMQRAERHLDEFWEKIDSFAQQHFGGSFGELFPDLDLASRDIRRTPRWVEAVPMATDIDSDDFPDKKLEFLNNYELASTSSRVSAPRIKVKTRGSIVEEEAMPTEYVHIQDDARERTADIRAQNTRPQGFPNSLLPAHIQQQHRAWAGKVAGFPSCDGQCRHRVHVPEAWKLCLAVHTNTGIGSSARYQLSRTTS